MAKNRRQRPEQEAAERAWKRRLSAGKIADRFPQAESITFDFTFGVEHVSGKTPEPQQHIRQADDSALFEFDCPLDCFGGGFSLDDMVQEAVDSGAATREGQLFCRGRQRSQGPHQCLMELNYQIAFAYEAD